MDPLVSQATRLHQKHPIRLTGVPVKSILTIYGSRSIRWWEKEKSALSSTKAWTKYTSNTIDDVLDKAERVKAISGGGKMKKSALSSTKAWTQYASSTIDDGLHKAELVKAISGGGSKLAWIPYVKKYAADHNVSYKEALSKASVGYKNQ